MTIKISACKADQLNLLRKVSMETYRDTFSASNSESLMQQYFADAMTAEKFLLEFNTKGSTFFFIYLKIRGSHHLVPIKSDNYCNH